MPKHYEQDVKQKAHALWLSGKIAPRIAEIVGVKNSKTIKAWAITGKWDEERLKINAEAEAKSKELILSEREKIVRLYGIGGRLALEAVVLNLQKLPLFDDNGNPILDDNGKQKVGVSPMVAYRMATSLATLQQVLGLSKTPGTNEEIMKLVFEDAAEEVVPVAPIANDIAESKEGGPAPIHPLFPHGRPSDTEQLASDQTG